MNVSYYYQRHSQSSIDVEEWLTAEKMAVSTITARAFNVYVYGYGDIIAVSCLGLDPGEQGTGYRSAGLAPPAAVCGETREDHPLHDQRESSLHRRPGHHMVRAAWQTRCHSQGTMTPQLQSGNFVISLSMRMFLFVFPEHP